MFIFSADLHLRPRTWNAHPDLIGDSYVALEAIVNLCLERHKPLLLAGDIFDSAKPHFEAVQVFVTQMARMQEAGLPVWVIVGNHDPEPWAVLAPGVTLVDQATFDLPIVGGSVMAYGLNYRHSSELQTVLANVPPNAKVLVCHQLLDLAFPKEGSFNMRADWVPGHVRTILMGDYHQAGQYREYDGPDRVFIYPGSTCLQNLGEPVEKSVYDVALSSFGTVDSMERIPLPSREVVDRIIHTSEELDELILSLDGLTEAAHLPEPIRKPIVRVRFNPDIPGVAGRLETAIGKKAFAFLSTLHAASEKTDTVPVGVSRREIMSSILDPNSPLFEFCMGLVETTDPKIYLREVRQRMGLESVPVLESTAA